MKTTTLRALLNPALANGQYTTETLDDTPVYGHEDVEGSSPPMVTFCLIDEVEVTFHAHQQVCFEEGQPTLIVDVDGQTWALRMYIGFPLPEEYVL